jgi:hypothetical protein
MNNETVWVVLYHRDGQCELRGVFSCQDRAEEFVVANSCGSLVRNDITDALYVCKYQDGIHHMTNAKYTIEERPVR